MKKLLTLLSILLLAAQAMASTVSISVSSNGGPMFATSTGDLLTLGSVIRIGSFDLSGANLATIQTSNDYNTINALFTPLGESGTPSGTVAQGNNPGSLLIINDMFGTGNVLGQIGNIEAAYMTAGQQLFAWVFNTSNPTSATEWGIFSATSGWNFPNSLGSETLATFEIDSILRGSTTGGIDTTDRLQLSVVPEPGTVLLLGLTLALRLRRQRRH